MKFNKDDVSSMAVELRKAYHNASISEKTAFMNVFFNLFFGFRPKAKGNYPFEGENNKEREIKFLICLWPSLNGGFADFGEPDFEKELKSLGARYKTITFDEAYWKHLSDSMRRVMKLLSDDFSDEKKELVERYFQFVKFHILEGQKQQ